MREPLSKLPGLARLILRLLGPTARVRAEGDLEDVYVRVAAVRGVGSARRSCIRESVWIVGWAVLDRMRRTGSRSGVERSKGGLMSTGFGQDVRFAVRALARRPGFTALAIGVLALGIGSNVAIYTLADRLFLASPPLVDSPDELVRVFRSWAPGAGGAVSYPDYLDYRDGNTTLSGLMAYGGPYAASARNGSGSVPADVMVVTADYFDVLGIQPRAGRFFRPEENETPGTHPVAVVSSGYWRDRMGSSPDAIGSDVVLNGSVFTVIGIAPDGFRGLSPGETQPDFWIPILMRDAIQPSSDTAWRERLADSRDRWLAVVGRRERGTSVEAVQTEMTVIADRIRQIEGLDADEAQTALVTSDFRWYPGSRTSLLGLTRVLLVTVGLLLAIAIANVAILLLARASARNREIGIRSALGAGRGQVVRQMLVESALLGAGGCVAGLLVSVGAARVAASLLPVRLDLTLLPNARVFAFAAAISLTAALLAGLLPALRAARIDVSGMIHGRDRGAGGGRVRDGLVVLQTALSLVLVAGAALFARSLASARSTDLGFEDRGVLYVGVNLRNHGYDEARGRVFVDDVLNRLRSVPGVRIATVTRQVPFRGDWSTDLEPWEGDAFADGRDVLTTGLNLVGPDYFEAMGMPIVQGRALTDEDRAGGPLSIVVNETFARLAFPEGDPVGQTVPLGGGQVNAMVVGVARDATYYELSEETWAQAWVAFEQIYQPAINFLIKTPGDPRALVSGVQQAIHAVDPDVAFTRTETLEAVAAEQTARYRASASVVGLSGFIALLLASAGLYGVMSYRVSRRTREIGVRIALGATRSVVAGGVLRRSLLLVVLGCGFGLAGTIVASRFIQGLVFGIEANDTLSLSVAPAVLLIVAMVAVLQPARRAAAVDPMRAMRTE